MEKVWIPAGKKLRYRCNVRGCLDSSRSFSLTTIIEHLASHYEKTTRSHNHLSYRCTKCSHHFYLLSMTTTCRCRKPGEQSDCVTVGQQWSPLAAQRDVDFFSYMQQHAVAVFETQGVEAEEKAMLAKPERKAEAGKTLHLSSTAQSSPWRGNQDPVYQENGQQRRTTCEQPGPSKSSYESTLLSSKNCVSGLPSRPLTPSIHSYPEMRSGQFGLEAEVPPPCQPSSGPTTAHKSLSVSNNTVFPWNYFPWGHYQGNRATPFMHATAGGQFYGTYDTKHDLQQHFYHGVPRMPFTHVSQFATNTTSLSVGHSNPVETSIARHPPQRSGGTKYLGTVPSRSIRKAVKKKRQRLSRRTNSE